MNVQSKATLPNLTAADPIPEAARDAVNALLDSGDLFRYTSPNAPVSLLENEFAQMMGSRFALAVASCSAALFLSLRALDLPANARVLVPGFTFAAVPSAVVHAGCVPVLVEVGADYRLDMVDFSEKLTDDISAILVSHMRGHTSDMDQILALAAAQNIPVVEDAAHSLGTLWDGKKIGTLGKIGCFSFQSYKMLNAGEGGILITDDADLIARAIIMSGAYEHNWRKHDAMEERLLHWQNRLPLYNTRMNNLSAAVIRPQLAALPQRVKDGRANHDHVASRLAACEWIDVPAQLAKEQRAPDSIQFNLMGMTEAQITAFVARANSKGLGVQVFGLSKDNARAFWNWQFLPEPVDLPRTKEMLMIACDVRLPARLTRPETELIADAILEALHEIMTTQHNAPI